MHRQQLRLIRRRFIGRTALTTELSIAESIERSAVEPSDRCATAKATPCGFGGAGIVQASYGAQAAL